MNKNSGFVDFIPEGKDTGPFDQGGYTDFIPDKPKQEAPVTPQVKEPVKRKRPARRKKQPPVVKKEPVVEKKEIEHHKKEEETTKKPDEVLKTPETKPEGTK